MVSSVSCRRDRRKNLKHEVGNDMPWSVSNLSCVWICGFILARRNLKSCLAASIQILTNPSSYLFSRLWLVLRIVLLQVSARQAHWKPPPETQIQRTSFSILSLLFWAMRRAAAWHVVSYSQWALVWIAVERMMAWTISLRTAKEQRLWMQRVSRTDVLMLLCQIPRTYIRLRSGASRTTHAIVNMAMITAFMLWMGFEGLKGYSVSFPSSPHDNYQGWCSLWRTADLPTVLAYPSTLAHR